MQSSTFVEEGSTLFYIILTMVLIGSTAMQCLP